MKKDIEVVKNYIKTYDDNLYPSYQANLEKERTYPWLKITSMLLAFSLLFAFILPWYIYLATGLLGLSLVIQILLRDGWSKSIKLYLLLLDVIGMLLLVDLGDGRLNWAVDYVIPLLLIMTIGSVIVTMLIRRKRWERYVGIQIYSILMAGALNVLVILKISHILWPSITALGLGLGTLALMALVFGRDYSLALGKFMHV